MQEKNKRIRNITIVAGAIIAIVLVFWFINSSSGINEILIKAKVEQGADRKSVV